jgi:hypothetical protein
MPNHIPSTLSSPPPERTPEELVSIAAVVVGPSDVLDNGLSEFQRECIPVVRVLPSSREGAMITAESEIAK